MSTVAIRTNLGDLAVLTGYLRLDVRGNWTAAVEVALSQVPSGPATLVVAPEARADDPAATPSTFAGTIRFADAIEGSNTLTIELVGGADQLLTDLPPVDHVAGVTDVPAGVILEAIVAALPGERLAPGVAQALDAYTLPRWHRAGGTTADDAIDILIADLAAVTGLEFGWRMQPDGAIWAGVETWPTLDVAASRTEYAGQVTTDAVVLYAPNGAPLIPGTTITSTGKGGALATRAVEVMYTLVAPQLRARVRSVMPGDPPRRADLSLYRTSWGATVAADNGDGTLDVTCDDARMGDLRSVPLRLGIPGCKVSVPSGARVRVAFENGSPRGAFCMAPDQDPAAAHALALVGDSCGYLLVTAPPGGGPCTIVVSPVQVPNATQVTVLGPGHRYVRGVSG